MSNIIPINFEGHSMRFYDDGWIDATTAAEKFDKVPNEFLRLPETESYIQGLERRYGKIPYVKTSRARKDRGGGTWLHPKTVKCGCRSPRLPCNRVGRSEGRHD